LKRRQHKLAAFFFASAPFSHPNILNNWQG